MKYESVVTTYQGAAMQPCLGLVVAARPPVGLWDILRRGAELQNGQPSTVGLVTGVKS